MKVQYNGPKKEIGILLPIGSGEGFDSRVMCKQGETVDLPDSEALKLVQINRFFTLILPKDIAEVDLKVETVDKKALKVEKTAEDAHKRIDAVEEKLEKPNKPVKKVTKKAKKKAK